MDHQGLELAYLYFLEQFRKVYIGEHAKQVVQQQVSERLATVLGLDYIEQCPHGPNLALHLG